MHWCADETAALMTFLSGLPFALRWVRAKARVFWTGLRTEKRPPGIYVVALALFVLIAFCIGEAIYVEGPLGWRLFLGIVGSLGFSTALVLVLWPRKKAL